MEPRDALGRNLTYGLLDSLGRKIVTGIYDRQPFPTEAQLTDEYAVSRSVTREAVKMLTAKGLLSARPRQGTIVLPRASWNLFDADVLDWLLERKFSIDLLLHGDDKLFQDISTFENDVNDQLIDRQLVISCEVEEGFQLVSKLVDGL